MKIKAKAWLKLKPTLAYGDYILILKVKFKDPHRFFPVTLSKELAKIDIAVIRNDEAYFTNFERNYISENVIMEEASKMIRDYFDTKYYITMNDNQWETIFDKIQRTKVEFEIDIDDEIVEQGER